VVKVTDIMWAALALVITIPVLVREWRRSIELDRNGK
jgi:hypothetical protein